MFLYKCVESICIYHFVTFLNIMELKKVKTVPSLMSTTNFVWSNLKCQNFTKSNRKELKNRILGKLAVSLLILFDKNDFIRIM